MPLEAWLFLSIGGLLSGFLAGLLGIGGALLLIPILVATGAQPVQATATSSLAILISAVSGTWQNWRMGKLQFHKVFYLSLAAVVTAQIGVYFASRFPSYVLLFCFGLLMLFNIYSIGLKRKLVKQGDPIPANSSKFGLVSARLATGSVAGLLAGFLGVGGGAALVPMQMLLLGETIKASIQTSLGVTVLAAISACIGHSLNGNLLWIEGITLGTGGLLGAQVGTRYLIQLPDSAVVFIFRSLLSFVAVYIFWQAWSAYWLGV
ncbi:sulfite exporter TauE/SafE family protein [Leptolyngbya sp. FACHB-261]|nr:sulfite exporter TauE/SafE family protein [Leptolyngbya sp. FACHB-261]